MSNIRAVYQQEQLQLELALSIMKTNHPFSYTDYSMVQWVKGTDSLSPYQLLAAGRQLRLEFIQHPDVTLNNPHNLTAYQVGAGYRLATKYEVENNIHQDQAEVWFKSVEPKGWNKMRHSMKANYGASIRIPASCPITIGPDVSTPPSTIEYQNRDGLPSAGYGYRFATKYEVINDIHQDQAEFLSYGQQWKKFKYTTMSQNWGCSIRVPLSCVTHTEPVKPVAPIRLEAKDILPGSRIRDPDWDDTEYETIQSVFIDRIYTHAGRRTYKALMDDKWLINYPGSSDWKPCHKQAV